MHVDAWVKPFFAITYKANNAQGIIPFGIIHIDSKKCPGINNAYEKRGSPYENACHEDVATTLSTSSNIN